MTQLLEDLRSLRAVLINPKRWTKYVFARNALRQPVLARDESATCWCLSGAMQVAVIGDPRGRRKRINAIAQVLEKQTTRQLSNFNDTSNHDEVIALIDETILAEEDAL